MSNKSMLSLYYTLITTLQICNYTMKNGSQFIFKIPIRTIIEVGV